MQRHIEQKRVEILDEMCQIVRLRQGTISEQYYGTGENRQGPYYVLQGYADGKHWSRRIPKDQVEQVKADLEAGAHFRDLCQEFSEVTEESTIMEDQPASKKTPGSAAGMLPRERSVPESDRGSGRRQLHSDINDNYTST